MIQKKNHTSVLLLEKPLKKHNIYTCGRPPEIFFRIIKKPGNAKNDLPGFLYLDILPVTMLAYHALLQDNFAIYNEKLPGGFIFPTFSKYSNKNYHP